MKLSWFDECIPQNCHNPDKKNSNGWIIASQEKAYYAYIYIYIYIYTYIQDLLTLTQQQLKVFKDPLIQTCSNRGGKSYPEEGQPNIPNTYLDRTQNDPHVGRFDP